MESVAENMRRCYGGPDIDCGNGLKARRWKDWSAGMRDGFAGASRDAIWYTGNRDEAFCIVDDDDDDGRYRVVEFYYGERGSFTLGRIYPGEVGEVVTRLLCK